MQVTRVFILYANHKDYGTCGEARLVFDDVLVVNRVSIINGKKGIFVGMPNRGHIDTEGDKKKFQDIIYTTNRNLRLEIEEKVLSAYYAKIEEQTQE